MCRGPVAMPDRGHSRSVRDWWYDRMKVSSKSDVRGDAVAQRRLA